MTYTIIVGDDNSLYGSQKIKIMHKEKLFNKIWFLVAPYYNEHDMSKCVVTMRYALPISKELKTETLVLSDERYEGYLKYILPIDTNLSKEWGNVELNLTFTMLDVDDSGNIVQRVRKTDNHILHITQLPNWDTFVADEYLSAVDQRIIMNQATQVRLEAQIQRLEEMNQIFADSKADNIKYNETENSLQLLSGEKEIGNKVTLKVGETLLKDGVPVVDLNSASGGNTPEEDIEDDNVIEF